MTWVKLDDQLHADPRLGAAGFEAFGLHCAALTWMGAFLTDGEITAVQVKRLAGRRGLTLAAKLVEVGFWIEISPEKWVVFEWKTYLISREEVVRERERKSAAGRAGARSTNAKRLETGPAGAAAGAAGTRGAPDPDPDPDPIPEKKKKEETPTPSGVGGVSGASGQALALPGFDPLPTPAAAVEESIFAAYLEGRKSRGMKGPAPVLDEPRRRMIRGRLAGGFEVETLRTAARGLWASDWHVAEKRTGFELCMRDAAAVEKCLGYAAAGDDGGEPPDPPTIPESARVYVLPPGPPPTAEETARFARTIADVFPAMREKVDAMIGGSNG